MSDEQEHHFKVWEGGQQDFIGEHRQDSKLSTPVRELLKVAKNTGLKHQNNQFSNKTNTKVISREQQSKNIRRGKGQLKKKWSTKIGTELVMLLTLLPMEIPWSVCHHRESPFTCHCTYITVLIYVKNTWKDMYLCQEHMSWDWWFHVGWCNHDFM